MGDWDLLARLTTERDPVALPAIACFYSTDAPRRLSTSGTLTDAETIRRRARVARGLVAPATPIRNPGPLLARVLSEGPLELGMGALAVRARAGALADLGARAGGGRVRRRREHGRARPTAARGRRRAAAGLEHHPGWAAQIRDRLAGEELSEWVEVVDAPLGPHELAPPTVAAGTRPRRSSGSGARSSCCWSTARPPTGPALERARYPALPALATEARCGRHHHPR